MRKYKKPHRVKRKKLFFQTKKFWYLVCFLLLIGTGFYFLFLSHFFEVKHLYLEGNQKINKDEFLNFLEKTLPTKFLFWNTKNIFLIKCADKKEIIFNQFPRLEELECKRKIPDTLFVKIKERNPVAVFQHETGLFFIDSSAIAFEKASQLPPNFLLIESQISPTQVILGNRVIAKEIFDSILKIFEKLKEINIQIVEVEIVTENKLVFKTKEGWSIYFRPDEIDWQIVKLKTVLEREIPIEKRPNLDYIDVRFENLAPYKLKK
jgi:cell division septal protein FtsQ